MLAAATFGVLVSGPMIIGYIPIMVVGALIFFLGIDLMREALVEPWGKVHRLEYLTVGLLPDLGIWVKCAYMPFLDCHHCRHYGRLGFRHWHLDRDSFGLRVLRSSDIPSLSHPK